jgi:uncharacterized protein YbaP (TraB family)
MNMHKLLFATLALGSLSVAHAQTEPVTLDAVLVTGELPGPPLWKVTKDDHVLWIMAIYGPVPKKVTWQSKAVEDAIVSSQEIITGPGLDVDIGFFRGLFLLSKWNKAQKNPNGAKLDTILPPDLYARFTAVKTKYAANDKKLEKLRPSFAAQALYQKAYEGAGLVANTAVYDTLVKVAKQNEVPFRNVWVKIEDPASYLSEMDTVPLEAHIDCMKVTLTRIETDMLAMRARGNAWATGDMDAIRYLPFVNTGSACWNTLTQTAGRFATVYNQQWPNWHTAIDDALSKNRSTFAYIGLSDLLNPTGPLATLRAKGYTVEEP